MKILIFCEGGNTEPDYIEAFARDNGNPLVRLYVEGAAGVPHTLLEKAIRARKLSRSSKDSFDQYDEFWIVFDRDEHNRIAETRNTARDHDINVAYSNPCFELWPIIHFDDHDSPCGRHEIQKKLQDLLPGYRTKGKNLDYNSLREHYTVAKNRAIRMRQRRISEGSPSGPPYTDVDLLTDAIIRHSIRKVS